MNEFLKLAKQNGGLACYFSLVLNCNCKEVLGYEQRVGKIHIAL